MTPGMTRSVARSIASAVLVFFATVGFMSVFGFPWTLRDKLWLALGPAVIALLIAIHAHWRWPNAARDREARA